MPFIHTNKLPKLTLFPGVVGAIEAGEHLMLSFLEFENGAEVKEHSHPHEQAGLVLEGRLRFSIGEEENVLASGQAFIVPPNVVHWGKVEEAPCRVLDVFSPPRKDYLDRYNRFSVTNENTVWK